MAHFCKLAFAACYLFSQPLFAFRCNNWPVERGDSKADVYNVCGEPDDINTHTETRKGAENHITYTEYGFDNAHWYPTSAVTVENTTADIYQTQVEEWTYHFRRGGIPKATILQFENDRLTSVLKNRIRGHR